MALALALHRLVERGAIEQSPLVTAIAAVSAGYVGGVALLDLDYSEDSGAELWRAYRTVAEGWKNFATKRIAKPADIFPVFRELFKKAEL